jgi:hypothetical protein
MNMDIDFLWWLRSVIFFSDITEKLLLKHGMSPGTTFWLIRSERFREHDVIAFLHLMRDYEPEVYDSVITEFRTNYDRITHQQAWLKRN